MLGSAHVQPRAVVLTGSHAVLACARLDVLPVTDLARARVDGGVRLPVAGAAPAGIAVTGEGGYPLATLERAGAFAVVDLWEWTVPRLVALGAGPRGITIDPDDGTVYCALAGQRSLAVVHLDGVDLSNTNGAPQFQEIPVGSGPSPVALAYVDGPLLAR
ncbi:MULTISPECIES: YncE family protein [unclassified Streptomyces]|uniref:YncE family protein n=1 Tax=unclassified Streptomyces TaxID=2593676 RepID=UPI0037F2EF23